MAHQKQPSANQLMNTAKHKLLFEMEKVVYNSAYKGQDPLVQAYLKKLQDNLGQVLDIHYDILTLEKNAFALKEQNIVLKENTKNIKKGHQ